MTTYRLSFLSLYVLFSSVALAYMFPIRAAAQVCNYCARPFELTPTKKADRVHTGVQFQYIYRGYVEGATANKETSKDEKVADTVINLYGQYDIDKDLSVEVNVPFISRAYSRYGPRENLSERETNLGDLVSIVSYNILSPRAKYDVITWQVRGGVKLPTGDSDYLRQEQDPSIYNSSTLVRGRDIAFGSGSVDIPLGTRVIYAEQGLFAFGDAGYILRTEGDYDYQYGNTLSLAGAFGGTVVSDARRSVRLAGVLRWDDRAQDSLSGSSVANSGNSVLALGPAIEAVFRDALQAHFEITTPVFRDANGAQLLPDYQLQISLLGYF
jgi:hypothetical protein